MIKSSAYPFPMLAGVSRGSASAFGPIPGDGAACPLGQRRILVAEDEALLALELAIELEDAGADVAVAPSLDEALGLAGRPEGFDGAILDINLNGREVFAAADLLFRRKVPIVFYTGHGRASEIGPRYPGSVTLNKPVASSLLIATLARLCAEEPRWPA